MQVEEMLVREYKDIPQTQFPSDEELRLKECYNIFGLRRIFAYYVHMYRSYDITEMMKKSYVKFSPYSFYFKDKSFISTLFIILIMRKEDEVDKCITDFFSKFIEKEYNKKCYDAMSTINPDKSVDFYAKSDKKLDKYDIKYNINFNSDNIYLIYTDCKYRKPYVHVVIKEI